MKKTDKTKPEKIPSKRDRVAKKIDDVVKVPKLPKLKKGSTLVEVFASDVEKPTKAAKKKTRDSKRTIVTGSIDVATEGQAVEHDLDEANKRCVKTARRLIEAESNLKTERKHCRDVVSASEVALKEAIERTIESSEDLDAWRKGVVSAWQESEEAIAGMDAVCDPIADDVKALRKALREQITNIDQLGLRF